MILDAGFEGFSMFELGKVGIFIAIAGIIYLFVFSKRLLPDARPDTAVPDEEVEEGEEGEKLHRVEAVLGARFPGINKKLKDFNFQRHFQEMGDQLGNKMATLVSLNFGHYFLKEGVYTLIGAETAQGLPNSQIYYSFIRGAGKQYGVNWFGNASVWNRWGWKSYDSNAEGIDNDYNSGGPLKGTSLGLLKRLIYTHLMYDCVAVGFEGSMRIDDKKLSPIGKIQQSAVKWVDKYGDPGVMYTCLLYTSPSPRDS